MNIAHLLLGSSQEFRDQVALARGMQAHGSYRDLWRKVSVMSTHLRVRFGLEIGDRVAFALSNCVESIEVMYAIWHAGLCAVPMNAKLHAKEFAYILENSGAKLCFVTPDLATSIAEAAQDASALKEIVDVTTRAYSFMAVGDPSLMTDCEPTDPAWLFYTSGTTGRPKGAVLSHRNLLAMTLNYYADVDRPVAGGSMVHAAPISHGSGLWNFPMLARGVTQVFPESGKYDVPETVELMNRWPDCSIFLAPTMVKRLVEHSVVGDLKPGALRLISYGGAPMYVSDLKRAMDTLGDVLCQLYGQGESPMTITHLSRAMHALRDHPRWEARLASAGVAATCVEVRVVDEEGRRLPAGEVGEIIVKGDTVMSGYWNNSEATAKSLRNGWLWTGDVGAFDEDGFLTLKDRSKDMIISGGSNIYPREIEDVLNLHPAVAECSVVGRTHPEWGEEVVAFVVTRPGMTLTSAELDQLCLENIARFKRPKDYRFIKALPKNNYGKILKTELRTLL
ncbi:Acyl-CoA synthetase (AMP-forming)/AMP-acid ligase II [Enhydrobacter aerosaccus]|uniref:3-methylmercaptopropionyl-CoA ligase n=1 Tax=Enhydrobacter aerosaccus TaxID=225324 RepID=A0A1T4RN41_9HYPH|nr:AMP-binding protein [Enhydrobacter aerosaccus]SKA17425.1 Acyl-CoA synthetase (AMP-forming)/AMP-acid ligase II [Enhydrobacter aerosaccus]